MKNIKLIPLVFLCALAITIPNMANAVSIIESSSINPTVEGWKNLKASDFVKLSMKDFRRITGTKMNVKERISFMVMKKGMKQELKNNPNLTVGEYLVAKKKMGTGWWILIGAAVLLTILLIIAFASFNSGGWF